MRALLLLQAMWLVALSESWTFYHVLPRPGVSYLAGLELIHTPEHLLRVYARDGSTLLCLKEPAQKPTRRDGNYSCITFELTPSLGHWNGDIKVQMLTNNRRESHFVVTHGETLLCTMSAQVRRMAKRGHTLTLQGQYWGNEPCTQLWRKQMFLVLAGLMTGEKTCCVCWEENVILGPKLTSGTPRDDDYYLKLYRKGVMRLME